MTEEEIRIMDSKKDSIYNNIIKDIDKTRKKKLPVKLMVPLVAILILVVAYSSNVFAFRTFLHQTFMTLTGTDLNVKTKKLTFENYNNIVKFEEKEEIIVPEWLPENMTLFKIHDEFGTLDLHFKSDTNWLTLRMKLSQENSKTKIETENNTYKIRKDKILGMECRIIEIVSETDLKTHMVYWNSNITNYSIISDVSEKNLKWLFYF